MSRGRTAAIQRLDDILDAADRIATYVARGREAFDADTTLQDAILYQIVVIGEASKAALAADPTIRDEAPDFEWSPIGRMRDRVVHHYWATDHDIVWSTAASSVPELRSAVARTLDRLAP